MAEALISLPVRLVPTAAQSLRFTCPLCRSVHAGYVFGTERFRIHRCAGCALTFSTTQFGSAARGKPSADPIAPSAPPQRDQSDYGSLIGALLAQPARGPVLVLADPDDVIVKLLQARGVPIGQIIDHVGIENDALTGEFDTVVLSNAIMRVADPRAALERIRSHMPVGGRLLVSVPLLDAQQARLMGRNWHEWQPHNLWYFNRETINLLLLAAGFEQVWFRNERRKYSLVGLIDRLRASPDGQMWVHLLETVRRISPRWLQNMGFRLPPGTAVVTATAAQESAECVVSIVVPVYNEGKTFQEMMSALVQKQILGIRKQIIIVESNSTDGSRELVQAYQGHPEVTILLQPGPRGKGNAVRAGLEAATGDIIMIQDADLEYDLDDYDGLLAPLVAWQSIFVLGSRHQGGWKMRKFADAPLTAALFNFGHAFFRTLINVAVNTKMADPFTMYKVFRRDALHGIDFVCNRFDFDIELVIKLVRKGYIPLELPVNYASRSFAEGKKVSVTRDGLTWVRTILKARFSPLGADT